MICVKSELKITNAILAGVREGLGLGTSQPTVPLVLFMMNEHQCGSVVVINNILSRKHQSSSSSPSYTIVFFYIHHYLFFQVFINTSSSSISYDNLPLFYHLSSFTILKYIFPIIITTIIINHRFSSHNIDFNIHHNHYSSMPPLSSAELPNYNHLIDIQPLASPSSTTTTIL